MDVLQAIVLGVVQGLTEFLPISSSGHLVLVPAVFGWEQHGLAFDVLLHTATVLAVVAYFRRDLTRMLAAAFSSYPDDATDRRLAWLVVVGTVPTVVVALLFGDFFEELFTLPGPTGVFLLVTALALVLGEWAARSATRPASDLRWWHAALIGLAQGAAIAPGISRSGATIATGLASGLSREGAARFSFLLSVPVVVAATAKTAVDALTGTATFPGVLPSIVGFAAAAVTGYLAIAGLLTYLRRRTLYAFAAYTAVVGTAVIIWQYVF